MIKLLFFISVAFIASTSSAQGKTFEAERQSLNNSTPPLKSNAEPSAIPSAVISNPSAVKKTNPIPMTKTSSLTPTGNSDFKRDPFRLPEYLIKKLVAAAAPIIDTTLKIDDSVEPIRRWPLATYTLIGIIWDVKNPKALVADQQHKVHLIRLNDKIGNQGAYVTNIREGSIMVLNGKSPEVLKLKK